MKFKYIVLILLLSACGPRVESPTNEGGVTATTNGEVNSKPIFTGPLPKALSLNSDANRIQVMSYNVENLFDAKDDANKRDETYLPLAIKATLPGHVSNCQRISRKSWRLECLNLDWTENTFQEKARRVAEVIRSANGGLGPDIVMLQEVENKAALKAVAKYLEDLGYKTYLREDSDTRGIDIGLLTKIPVKSVKLKSLKRSRRKALVAEFNLPDSEDTLTVFGVHFIAGGDSVFNLRVDMLKKLIQLNEEISGPSLVVGDLNFNNSDVDEKQVIGKFMRPALTPAHLFCNKCKGSYARSATNWSYLDMILVPEKLFSSNTRWTIDTDSYVDSPTLDIQTRLDGRPKKFDINSQYGVSDHLPIVIDLVQNK